MQMQVMLVNVPHLAQLGFFLKNSRLRLLICPDPGDPGRGHRTPSTPQGSPSPATGSRPSRWPSASPIRLPAISFSAAVTVFPPLRSRGPPCRSRAPWAVPCRLQMDSVGSRAPVHRYANAAFARRHLLSSSRASITRWPGGRTGLREEERGKRGWEQSYWNRTEPNSDVTTLAGTLSSGGSASREIRFAEHWRPPPISIPYRSIGHTRGADGGGGSSTTVLRMLGTAPAALQRKSIG